MEKGQEEKKPNFLHEQHSELLQQFIDSLNDAIAIQDFETGQVLAVNQAWYELVGVKPVDDVRSINIDDVSFAEEGYSHKDAVRSFTNLKVGDSMRLEWKGKTATGKLLWTEVSLKISEFAGRKMVFVTVLDIRERMEAEQAKTEFVSLASHQLRAPLTNIKLILELAQRRSWETSTWQKEALISALKSTDRMTELTNDLLKVSRLEAGLLTANIEEVELGNFLKEIVKNYDAPTKEKKQQVRLKKPSSEVRAHVDPELVKQTLLGLLSNAMHYSDEYSVIKLNLSNDEGNIKIAVKDKGIGISDEEQGKLFTKFFRSPEAFKRYKAGAGLGLYVAKKIVSATGGQIEVQSKLGEGSTFTIVIPATPSANSA